MYTGITKFRGISNYHLSIKNKGNKTDVVIAGHSAYFLLFGQLLECLRTARQQGGLCGGGGENTLTFLVDRLQVQGEAMCRRKPFENFYFSCFSTYVFSPYSPQNFIETNQFAI